MKLTILRLMIALAALVAATPAALRATESADALLDKAAARLAASKSVTARFTLASGGSKSSGSITMSGDRFHVATPELTTWYDGRTQWTYAPAASEVNITEPTPDELQQINPFAIINAFRRNYKASLAGSTASTRTVALTARTKGADIKTVALTLNAKTLYPTRIIITTADNRRLTITVTDVKAGPALPATAFTFPEKKYPGVEIVDLR